MPTLILSLIILIFSLGHAWKKRKYDWMSISLLFAASILPVLATLIKCTRLGSNRAWEDMVIGMLWEAFLMIPGLCIMYGSKTMHYLGRWMMIFSIGGISLLLAGMLFSY